MDRYEAAPPHLKCQADERFSLVMQVHEAIGRGAPIGGACRTVAAAHDLSAATVKSAWRLVERLPQDQWRAALVPPVVFEAEKAASRELEAPVMGEQLDVTRAFWMSGETLPAFLNVEGRMLVLIGHEEYKDLIGARTTLLRQAIEPKHPVAAPGPRLGLSTIERDPEVADFLRARFHKGVTVAQLHAGCVAQFGMDRTPSMPRITRFRLAVRETR